LRSGWQCSSEQQRGQQSDTCEPHGNTHLRRQYTTAVTG
jgi:hypothetical protein